MAHDVFISYSHHDKPAADAICAKLEGEKLRCWIAPRDIPAGADWAAAINDGITASRAIVLVVSEHANNSRQVKIELTIASSAKIPVIPFHIKNVNLAPPFELARAAPETPKPTAKTRGKILSVALGAAALAAVAVALLWLRPSVQELDDQADTAFKQQNYQQAFTLFSQAAARGNAMAENNLGLMYQYGKGVTQDYGQALAWYQKAAAQNVAMADNNLGVLYLKGLGVTQNYSQAFNWYQKAAAQGDPVSEMVIGAMYENGDGVTQNDTQARAWITKAAAAGNQYAKAWLTAHPQ